MANMSVSTVCLCLSFILFCFSFPVFVSEENLQKYNVCNKRDPVVQHDAFDFSLWCVKITQWCLIVSAALQLHRVREEVAAGARESGPQSLLLVSTQRKMLLSHRGVAQKRAWMIHARSAVRSARRRCRPRNGPHRTREGTRSFSRTHWCFINLKVSVGYDFHTVYTKFGVWNEPGPHWKFWNRTTFWRVSEIFLFFFFFFFHCQIKSSWLAF